MRTKYASTRFSIVKRSKGQSAVDAASYISRSVLVSEYDGKTYRPKYHEDLVHCEINLPEYAPEEWLDRAVLWNSVELNEKQKNAQLCRTLKAALPNDWSYELAEETVRDYVQRNFVSKGMCADWAIHDSVNQNGIHNLHFHLIWGEWVPIQFRENVIRIIGSYGNKAKPIEYNTEIQELEKHLMSLIEESAKGNCGEEDFDREYRRVTAHLKELRKRKEQSRKEQRLAEAYDQRAGEVDDYIRKAGVLSREFDNDLVWRLIQTVKVINQNKIELQFRSGIVMVQRLDKWEN